MAAKDRAVRWLQSNKNIAGCVLAIGGPVLAITGVLAPPVALGLIPVLYVIGALAAPANKVSDLAAGLDTDDVERSLRTIRNAVRNKVISAISTRIENICALIEQVLPRAYQLGPGSNEMHVLVRTATDYLPGTLQPYLALPRAYAEKQPLADGQTAAQILCTQLDVMTARMESVRDAVLRADSDKLLANGRFLEEKFGRHGLKLPASSLPPPSAPELKNGDT